MSSWLPVPGTTTGKLVASALRLFGARGFADVSVMEISKDAGVTTGALYHHFGSKTGLWNLVRTDVEQRVLDRVEGAAAVTNPSSVPALVPALLAGFDYLVRTGYVHLLADAPHPDENDPAPKDDRIAAAIDALLTEEGPRVGGIVSAAWRAALTIAVSEAGSVAEARGGLARVLGHDPTGSAS